MKNIISLLSILCVWTLPFCMVCMVHAATPSPLPENLAPNAALQELKDGNEHFVQGSANPCAGAKFTRTQLTSGQAPNTAVFSCSDSRVPPEQVFDQGDYFSGRSTKIWHNFLILRLYASIPYQTFKHSEWHSSFILASTQPRIPFEVE